MAKVKLTRKTLSVPTPRRTSSSVIQAQLRSSPHKDLWTDILEFPDAAQARDAMYRLAGAGGNSRYRTVTVHEEA